MRHFLLALLGLSSVLLSSGCQPKNQLITPPPPAVTVATPLKRPVQDYYYTTGQTRAVASVQILARVGGYLNEIRFHDGDLVQKDQILFVIDQDTYQATLDSAKAALAKSVAQLDLAERQFKRTSQLIRDNATTESSFDNQEAERAVAIADVSSAKAALRQAELNMQYTEVRAPFAGRIGRHLVDLGNLVAAGTTLLVSLEAVDPIHAYFTMSEQDLIRFMESAKAGRIPQINTQSPPEFELGLGNSSDFLFKGKLDFREFGVNPQTGTTERRIVIDNKDVELVPGMFCRLRAKVGEPRESLLVDERAVQTDQRGAYLLTVNKEDKVELQMVKTGILIDGLRVIESGISEEQQVVINGLQLARPNSVVKPTVVSMDSRSSKAADTAKKHQAGAPGAHGMEAKTGATSATTPPSTSEPTPQDQKTP